MKHLNPDCEYLEAYRNGYPTNSGLIVIVRDGKRGVVFPVECTERGCPCKSCADWRDAQIPWEDVDGGQVAQEGEMWRFRKARGENPSGWVLSRDEAIEQLNSGS